MLANLRRYIVVLQGPARMMKPSMRISSPTWADFDVFAASVVRVLAQSE